jgi:hypothetical protein
MLSRADTLAALAGLADELRTRSVDGEMVLAGRAAIVLLHDTRPATRAVDVILRTPAGPIRESVETVTQELGLEADGLNDRARIFASDVTLGETVFAKPGLLVRTASPEQLLAMKISAMRDSADYADARLLLESLGSSREAAWEG